MMDVLVFVSMIMLVFVFMIMNMIMVVVVVMVVCREMDIEFRAGDVRFLSAGGVQVIPLEIQLLQFVLELMQINSKLEQRADEHIPADAAD